MSIIIQIMVYPHLNMVSQVCSINCLSIYINNTSHMYTSITQPSQSYTITFFSTVLSTTLVNPPSTITAYSTSHFSLQNTGADSKLPVPSPEDSQEALVLLQVSKPTLKIKKTFIDKNTTTIHKNTTCHSHSSSLRIVTSHLASCHFAYMSL